MVHTQGAWISSHLGLFMYYPSIHCIKRNAMMDVKPESCREKSFLWKLLNDILAEITGKPGYQFNHKTIIRDVIGDHFCSIREVFSLDFVMFRVVSCQMNYKSDLSKTSVKVRQVSKGDFRHFAVR